MSQHSSSGRAWQKTRLAVLNRDAWSCFHCGKHLEDGPDAQVDHLTPKAKGGTDAMWNLVASCAKCNNSKSDRELVRTNWWSTDWLTHL